VTVVYLIYSVLLTIAFCLSLPFYLWKGRGTGRYSAPFLARMRGPGDSLNVEGRPFWIHAVSVGEVLAARSLIRPLKERFPEVKIFVSTTTVTGQGVARASLRGVDGVFYAPFDWAGPVRRTLRGLRPALLVLMETEIWPNLIHEAKRHGARVAIVNGRISPRSFSRYRRIRGFMARVLSDVDLFLMQGEAHAQRIQALGAPPEARARGGELEVRRRRGSGRRGSCGPVREEGRSARSGSPAAPSRARKRWCYERTSAFAKRCRRPA
jgi:3-deoxy-D-manno-octulosonic-acid transferase